MLRWANRILPRGVRVRDRPLQVHRRGHAERGRRWPRRAHAAGAPASIRVRTGSPTGSRDCGCSRSTTPASQATKLARLRRLLGEEPRESVCAPRLRDDLATEMRRARHDEAACSSGRAWRLSTGAVAGPPGWAYTSRAHRSSSTRSGRAPSRGESKLYGAPELGRVLDSVAEPLRWGIPDGEVAETLERFPGFAPSGSSTTRTPWPHT